MAGHIERRQNGDGSVSWRATLVVGVDPLTGRPVRRRETFPTRRGASAALVGWAAEVAAGAMPLPSGVTVGEYLAHYLDVSRGPRLADTTMAHYRWLLERHIAPRLGSVPLQRLDPSQIERALAGIDAAHVRAQVYGLLRAGLGHAHRQEVVGRNAALLVDPPRRPRGRHRIWDPAEVAAFLLVADGSTYAPIYLAAITTGMRREELLGLRWADVEFAAALLTIRQTVVALRGGTQTRDRAKNDPSYGRVVHLDALTVAALAAKRAQVAEWRALGEGRVGPRERWIEHDLVFPSTVGTPITPANLFKDYLKQIERAGVPRIRFHDLRHTHASWALASGATIAEVAARLGHARISTTADFYLKSLGADAQRKLARGVGDLLAAGRDDTTGDTR